MEAEELHMLLRGVLEHSDPKMGLSNDLVERFCFLLAEGGESSSFKGVYSIDRLPPSLLLDGGDLALVVNLGETKNIKKGADLPLGHFVALVSSEAKEGKGELRYFDSYALPVWQPILRGLLQRWREKGRSVELCCKRPIQDENSRACGLYAALFAIYFDPSRRPKPDFPLRFHRRKLKRNDVLCAAYLRRLIYTPAAAAAI